MLLKDKYKFINSHQKIFCKKKEVFLVMIKKYNLQKLHVFMI
jgi:hypothetical protein